jgi:hypothetical protein
LERKAELLSELQIKLANAESDPAAVKFGIVSEICNALDTDGIFPDYKPAALHQRLGEFLSPEFELALQRAVLLNEADKYLAQAVI